jgi:hypothetical protein
MPVTRIKTLAAIGAILLQHPARGETLLGGGVFSSMNASSVVALPDFGEFHSNLPLVILNPFGQGLRERQTCSAN